MRDHSIQRANHGVGPALHGGGASKWDMKEALLRRAEVAGTPSANRFLSINVSYNAGLHIFIIPYIFKIEFHMNCKNTYIQLLSSTIISR